MVYKSLGLVVMLVLCMALVVDADFGDEIDRVKIASSTCLQKCMVICMKIKTAVEFQCQKACDLGCKQLQGKGSIFYRPQ
ncbi:hypothetical protein CR513_56845, partial [Mucuna pruriens]